VRAERRLLRLGDYLVRRACERLPEDVREERFREWAGELPAILHDPQVRFAPRRAARMLCYAADTRRGAATTPVEGRAFYLLLATAGLVSVALSIQNIVRAPGNGLNYVQLAWEVLLVAWPIGRLARSANRTTALITMSSSLAGMTFFLWNAAQAPGDWVNYFWAASFFLAFLAVWLFRSVGPYRWA
jgi:hypothetical protein